MSNGRDCTYRAHSTHIFSIHSHTYPGHFYLTKLLLPTLLATATLEPGSYNKPRIVTVSSGAHHLHDIDYATLKDGPERRRLGTQALYAQSKYASVVFARELARRYGDQGLVSIAMNPGNLKTNLQKEVAGWQRVIVRRRFFRYFFPFDHSETVWCLMAEGRLDASFGAPERYSYPPLRWYRGGSGRLQRKSTYPHSFIVPTGPGG